MSRGSVLVVEDTEEIRVLVTTVLERARLTVRAVGTARECLAEVAAEAPDLIVLDLGLPDADGTELCRELRTRTQAYVLMLTARAEEVDVLVGLAVGADGYMAKPFSPGSSPPGCRRSCVARTRSPLPRSPSR